MMKTAVVMSAALALAAPWAMAQEKKADAPVSKTEAAKAPAKPVAATGAGTAANRSETRDWARIDSNRDNLISPDEMEKYLQESWAAQKK